MLLLTEFVEKHGLFLSFLKIFGLCFVTLCQKVRERHTDVLLHNEQFPGKVIGESEDSMTN